MGTILALVLSFALYVALPLVAPFFSHTAVIFPLLSSLPKVGSFFGAFTYKGVVAFFVLGMLARRL